MFKLVLSLLLLFALGFGGEPSPFGLKLGKTTEGEFLKVVEDRGWRVEKSGYRIIKGDVSNPEVSGYQIGGINLDKLSQAFFWFYKGVLFQVEYRLYENMSKETFKYYYEQLRAKYGRPSVYREPWLQNGRAVWKFRNVTLELYSPWVGRVTYLTYTHRRLNAEAERSDKKHYREYIKRKSRTTEGI